MDARRYARHILLPEVGGIGQRALLAARVWVGGHDEDAGVICRRFLVAGGVTVDPDPDSDSGVEAVTVTEADRGRVAGCGAERPSWWPGADGDAAALAWWRGAMAATRVMTEIVEAARAPALLPSEAMLDELVRLARAAMPYECCGYLVGPRDEDRVDAIVPCVNAQASGEHPIAPERGAETGFVIAGRELFDFVRSLDTDRPAKIVYHSHTNGRAYFSDVDQAVAAQSRYPVQHLVVTPTGEAALFVYSPTRDRHVERWRR